jgi:hypothetical protein
MKKKKSALHWNNRKDAVRQSQELARLYPLQVQGFERVNSFERLSHEERITGVPCSPYCQRRCSPKDSFCHFQLPSHWSNEAQILLELVADCCSIPMVLALQACTMQE